MYVVLTARVVKIATNSSGADKFAGAAPTSIGSPSPGHFARGRWPSGPRWRRGDTHLH